MHIPEISPDILFSIGPIPITNTVVNVWLGIILLLVLGIYLKKNISLRPGKVQNTCEFFLEIILNLFDQVTLDRKRTLKFLPIVGTVFIFILLSNWLGLMPGTGSLMYGGKMFFRPANTDFNMVAVMTLCVLLASHLYGLLTVGVFTYLGKFIQIKNVWLSLKKGPLAIFSALIEMGVGFIEIISEMAKVLSLSFRLFGNVFAGEILITVMSSLVSFLVPTPFMFLEILVGLVQAGVFAILSLVYLSIATSQPHSSDESAIAH